MGDNGTRAPGDSASRPEAARAVAWAVGLGAAWAVAFVAVAAAGFRPLGAALAAGPAAADLVAAGARLPGLPASDAVPRAFLAAWLHTDLGHLASNALWAPLLAGWVAHRVPGPGLPAAALVGGAAAGHILALSGPGRGVGASGGIYALVAVLVVRVAARPRPPVGPRERVAAGLLGLMFGALPLVMAPSADHLAHLGGGLLGLGLAAAPRALPRIALTTVAMSHIAVAAAILPNGPSTGPPPPESPVLPLDGRWSLTGCAPAPTARAPEQDAGATLACTGQPGRWIALDGTHLALLAHHPELAAHLPPPGHCAQWTDEDEQVWVAHGPTGRVALVAATRATSRATAAVREALRDQPALAMPIGARSRCR